MNGWWFTFGVLVGGICWSVVTWGVIETRSLRRRIHDSNRIRDALRRERAEVTTTVIDGGTRPDLLIRNIAPVIDDLSLDQTGWARFSDDRTKRYRVARILDPRVRPLWSTSPGFEPTAVFHGTLFDQYAWDASIDDLVRGEVHELLVLAEIPHTLISRRSHWNAFDTVVDYPADWILEHGFTITGDPNDPESTIHHPRFSEDW